MSILTNYSSDTFLLVWLALFPLTYLAHVAEECWCGDGYSAYLFKNYGVELSPPRFLALHSLGLVLMIMSIILAVNLRFPYTMLVILGATVLLDGATHTTRRFTNGHYGPGLITAIGLWIPLGGATLASIWGSMTITRFVIAASIGAAIGAVVEVIAMRGGRLLRSCH